KTELKGITAVRVDVLSDKTLTRGGPGRSANGNFVLTKFAVEEVKPTTRPVALANPSASHEQDGGFTAAASVDPKKPEPRVGWAILDRTGQSHYAVFETVGDVATSGDTTLSFTLEQNWGEQHTIGTLRISVTNDPRPVRADKPA